MKKFLTIHHSLFYVIALLLIIIPLYTYKLGTIPINVTGDETTYLGVAYRVMFEITPLNPFQLMEDHTKAALDFYWMALITRIVGLDHAVFGMRLAIVIPAIGTLLTFFVLLKQRTNSFIAFATTLLLGTNILFLNFARSGWLNIVAVFFGTLMIYFLKKGFRRQRVRFFIYAALCASFSCYWYLSGYIYPISAIIFFLISILFSKKRKQYGKYFLVFLGISAIIIIPVFIMAYLYRDVSIVRPSVVFIFNNTSDNIAVTLIKQIKDVGLGLIFLDKHTIGKGFENPRYFPVNMSIVDPIARLFFLGGLIYFVYKFVRKPFLNIWMIIFVVTFLTVGILTIDAPNLARTILVVPCIYFLVGVSCFTIFQKIKTTISQYALSASLCIVGSTIIFINITTYFMWAQSETVAADRQPAIEYSEFNEWQTYQISLIKSGKLPIINQQWYNIRDNK